MNANSNDSVQKKCGFWVTVMSACELLCHVVSAIFPPGHKGKTLREGVVTIDFGMNLLDVCCRNESLTATLLLKSGLGAIS